MKLKNILMSCVIVFGGLSLSGCYTQLSMFHPEIENDDSEEFYSYSSAGPMKSIGIYAQDGAGQSLGMAYNMMYNRFYGMYTNWGSQYGSGYYNKYDYYNRYGYHAGYNSYNIAGYKMYIPQSDNKTPRTWSRDSKSTTTNLNVTRTRTNTTESSYNNSSNVSNTRSTTSNTSSSSSNRRVTRRN